MQRYPIRFVYTINKTFFFGISPKFYLAQGTALRVEVVANGTIGMKRREATRVLSDKRKEIIVKVKKEMLYI